MKRADLAEKTFNYSKNLCFPNSWSCASELLFGCFLIVPNHRKEPLWQKIRKLLIMNRQIWKIR